MAARLVHDLGLAAWFGGAAMGAVGLNSATREVDDHTQRPAGASALGRLPGRSSSRAAPLGWVRLGLTGCAVAATAETGRSGQQVVQAGDVPAATAVRPIAETPDHVAAAQRRLRVAQWLVPAFTGAIRLVNALQDGG